MPGSGRSVVRDDPDSAAYLRTLEKLHKAGYFRELLATNRDIDEGLCSLLRLCRETVDRVQRNFQVVETNNCIAA